MAQRSDTPPRPRGAPPPDGAPTPERRSKNSGRRTSDSVDEEKRGPVYDVSRLYKYARIWRKTEKSVIAVLRFAAWDEGSPKIGWEPPTHEVSVSPSPTSDPAVFWATPPGDADVDAWARDETRQRYGESARVVGVLDLRRPDAPRLFTPRISAREIAKRCGKDCSWRSAQRVIAVLEKAGVVTAYREKKDDGQNLPNGYQVHRERLLELEPERDRPKDWDLKEKADGGGYVMAAPPPTPHAEALEALRTRVNLPPFDPGVRKLGKIAAKADLEEERLPIAAAALVERQRRQDTRVTTYRAELTKLEARAAAERAAAELAAARARAEGTTPHAGQRRAPAPESRVPARGSATSPAAEPPVEDEAAQLAILRAQGLLEEDLVDVEDEAARFFRLAFAGLEAAAVAWKFTGEVLEKLRSYPALADRANEEDARKAARMAWTTSPLFYPIESSLHAIEAFNKKVLKGTYQPDLAALLKFLQVQRVRRDPPPVSTLQHGGSWRPTGAGNKAGVPVEPPPPRTVAPEARAAALPAEPVPVVPDTPREGQAIFDQAREHVRALSPYTFDQWFDGVRFDGFAAGVLSLTAPNEFVLEWVKHNFLPALVDKICELTGDGFEVTWAVDPSLPAPVQASAPPRRRPAP